MSARNLTDLPVELLSEVISYLRPSPNERPEIGVSAAWTTIGGPNDEVYYEERELGNDTDEERSEEMDEQDDHEVEPEGDGENESEDEDAEAESTNSQTSTKPSCVNSILATEGSSEADEPTIQFSADGVIADGSENGTKQIPKSEESLSAANEVSSKGLAPLLALRSTSSIFNALCVPVIYCDLKLLKREKIQDIIDLAVVPYSSSIKVLRMTCGLSDDDIALILQHTPNVKSILLYDMEELAEKTGNAIVKLLTEGHLDSLGLYDSAVLANVRDHTALPIAAIQMINLIGNNEQALRSLKRLDLCFASIGRSTYDTVRRQLLNIEYMTFNLSLAWNLSDGMWCHDKERNWLSYSHLHNLQFRACEIAYAPHIPLIVRHFPALKYLLISACGNFDDARSPSPPKGWYQAQDALWKVHEPLETFHIEDALTWEIACMTEIPVKNLIVTDVRGDFLTKALEDDLNYFPGLQTIRIQPEKSGYHTNSQSFAPNVLEALIKYCENRGVELRRDAIATSLYHY